MTMTRGNRVLLAIIALVIFAVILNYRDTARVAPDITTKEGYLEVVRRNNPEDPRLYACIYDQLIDRHGLAEVKRLDLAHGSEDAEPLPAEYRKEVTKIAADCEGAW